MPFQKNKSIVPVCDRIAERYGELRAEDILAVLPDKADNADKPGVLRKKYFLVGNDSDDFEHHHAGEVAPLLERWPAALKLLQDFPGKVIRCHLSIMEPGGVLGVHRDGFTKTGQRKPGFPLFNSTIRFHIPMTTTERSFNYVKGRFYKMLPGELWTFNNMLHHAAINLDEGEPRMHLIFDVEPNYETMKLAYSGESGLGREDRGFFKTHWPEYEML